MTANRLSLLSLLNVILSFFTFSSVNAQWEMRYPEIQTSFITDMIFINNNTGFFINSAGSLMMTTDMGTTWKRKVSFQGQRLDEIRFIDEKTGYIMSRGSKYNERAVFFYTTDGGNTWYGSDIIMSNTVNFLPISTSLVIKSERSGEIQRLDNFFGNWITVYKMPRFNQGCVISPYGSIPEFQKLSDRILALGHNAHAKSARVISDSVSFILQSKDQGSNWDTLWCGLPYSMYVFKFANDKLGWMGGESQHIYKTSNGGKSWTLQYSTPENGASINDIFLLDSLNIYAIDDWGNLISSNNGGINWTIKKIFSSTDDHAEKYLVRFVNRQKGFVIGPDLLVTENSGQSWDRFSKSIKDNILKIDFVNESLGWAISKYSIYFTLDGGYHWTEQYKPTSGSELHSLDMIDSENGWAADGNVLYHTIDGKTWQPLVIDPNLFFLGSINFFDKNNGILFKSWGKYSGQEHLVNHITTDAGKTWQSYFLNNESDFYSDYKVDYSDKYHLWHCGKKGLFLSTDQGRTWTLKKPESYVSGFTSPHADFLDSLNGWVEDGFDSISVTSDGGNTWKKIHKPLYAQSTDLLTVGKINNNTTFAMESGENGSLVRYFPDYSEGIIQDTYTNSTLRSIAQFNSGNQANLWAAGDDFTVLYFKDFILDVKKEEHKDLEYSLSQNYPNPFNPTTTITYSLAQQSHVELKIFDMLGREITTLVSKVQNSGEYKVQFDGSSLPSGIYIYKIQAGEYRASRKIVLIR